MRFPLIAAILMLSAPSFAADASSADHESVARASQLIYQGKPADGVVLLDAVIATNEARYRGQKGLVFCARTPAETVLYLGEAATKRQEAITVGPDYCDAIFLKGFALIDLGQPAAARDYLQRAVNMAPHNAYYRGELAESFKTEHDWQRAYGEFSRAEADARSFSPDEVRSDELARAWRGMAYVLSEQSRYREAETLLRKCLELDSSDDKAKRELQYVHDQLNPKTS